MHYAPSVSLEAIYDDLGRISRQQGELSEATVAVATTLLARPRYAASPNPAGLLVEDLERVIEAIPNEPGPGSKSLADWSALNFRSYARRYFSLDEPGATLTHRRRFGRTSEPGGSETAWMTRAVLLRVASALLVLEAEEAAPNPSAGRPRDYRIESVRAFTRFYRDIPLPEARWRLFPDRRYLLFPFHARIEYTIRLSNGEREGSFDLPFPRRHTRLEGLSGQQMIGERSAERGPNVPIVGFRGRPASESQRQSGGVVQFAVHYRPFFAKPPRTGIAVEYRVEQPVDELTLQVKVDFAPFEYEWTVWGPDVGTNGILPVDGPLWHTTTPKVGHTYSLFGDEAGSGGSRGTADALTGASSVT